MDQHYRFSDGVDQVMDVDAARVKNLRLERTGDIPRPQQYEPHEERRFSDRVIGPLKGEPDPHREAIIRRIAQTQDRVIVDVGRASAGELQ